MVKDEALLVDDLGVSSLDRFELIMDLEAELGLEIREEDLVGAKTVADVIRCIDAQIKAPRARRAPEAPAIADGPDRDRRQPEITTRTDDRHLAPIARRRRTFELRP